MAEPEPCYDGFGMNEWIFNWWRYFIIYWPANVYGVVTLLEFINLISVISKMVKNNGFWGFDDAIERDAMESIEETVNFVSMKQLR